jgi:hypothetical protein
MTHDVARFRFLIRDNATVFVAASDEIFTTNRIDVTHTPPGAPRANATAPTVASTNAPPPASTRRHPNLSPSTGSVGAESSTD